MIVEKKNAGITRSMIITENKLVEIGNDNQQIWHLIYKTQNEKDKKSEPSPISLFVI